MKRFWIRNEIKQTISECKEYIKSALLQDHIRDTDIRNIIFCLDRLLPKLRKYYIGTVNNSAYFKYSEIPFDDGRIRATIDCIDEHLDYLLDSKILNIAIPLIQRHRDRLANTLITSTITQ